MKVNKKNSTSFQTASIQGWVKDLLLPSSIPQLSAVQLRERSNAYLELLKIKSRTNIFLTLKKKKRKNHTDAILTLHWQKSQVCSCDLNCPSPGRAEHLKPLQCSTALNVRVNSPSHGLSTEGTNGSVQSHPVLDHK